MDFLQLQTFKAIVDEGSVLGAAEALHCVQSNVTARIRSLEHTVGVKLFHRQGRRLQLTPSGRTLLGYADRILALSREASAALNPSSEPSGDFSLGAIESSATSRLPAVLARFHAAYPKVRLNLVTDTSLNLLDEIQHGRVDAALIAGTACLEAQAQAFVVADEIYREPIVLVAPARADTVHEAADLAGATLLMWPPGCPYRATMEQWLASNTVTPGRILSYGSYATIVACVGGRRLLAGAARRVSALPARGGHRWARAGRSGRRAELLRPASRCGCASGTRGVPEGHAGLCVGSAGSARGLTVPRHAKDR